MVDAKYHLYIYIITGIQYNICFNLYSNSDLISSAYILYKVYFYQTHDDDCWELLVFL